MSATRQHLLSLSKDISDLLLTVTEPSASQISVKSELKSLLLIQDCQNDEDATTSFVLACALLSSSLTSTNPLLSWIPQRLGLAAKVSLHDLSAKTHCLNNAYVRDNALHETNLVLQVIPRALHLLKDRIKETSIDKSKENDLVSAACARTPVEYSIMAAIQFRWLVTQIEGESWKNMCSLVIPCGLTALDHWSPQVKVEGMLSFVCMAKNVKADYITVYQDPLLEAYCQNIVSADEIWKNAVEMTVYLVALIHHSNPRSSWYENIFSEMLNHLERHSRNKDRRVPWLKFIDPFLNCLGLTLLAYFRRLFPLFFMWMHADDDDTVLLVLPRITTVIKMTWIRNTAYIERLVDELALLYKEAALRSSREEIRKEVIVLMRLLQQGKFRHFDGAWRKHADDSNLTSLKSALTNYEDTNNHLV